VVRLLGAVRLSHETDETTSPVRQRKAIESYATANGHTVVAFAEDLDVSGAVEPRKRPQLGQWLARPDDWDAVIAAKPDRLSRSLRDFLNFWHELDEQGKALISIDPALDFSTAQGRLVANILLSFAEFEREMISARVKDAHRHIKQGSGYPGGPVPFGYLARKRDGKGWEYAPDPDFAPIVREMAERTLSGISMRQTSIWLNEQGVPTSRDVLRRRQGKPETDAKWTTQTVRAVLTSPAIAGLHTTEGGKPLRDTDGMPVRRCEGIIDVLTWERLVRQVKGAGHSVHRVDANPLLQVAFCAVCGDPFYTTVARSPKGRSYRYYRCSRQASKTTCGNRSIPADALESWAADIFLGLVGDLDHFERIHIPAEDHERELAGASEAIEHLDSEYDAGKLHASAYSRMVSRLEDKREQLSKLPVRAASVERRPTGRTFAQEWEARDEQARRRLMRNSGFEIRAARTADGYSIAFQIDPELAERAQRAAAGETVGIPGHEAVQSSWELPGRSYTFASAEELA
jgi:site-specific DNA recombinase